MRSFDWAAEILRWIEPVLFSAIAQSMVYAALASVFGR